MAPGGIDGAGEVVWQLNLSQLGGQLGASAGGQLHQLLSDCEHPSLLSGCACAMPAETVTNPAATIATARRPLPTCAHPAAMRTALIW